MMLSFAVFEDKTRGEDGAFELRHALMLGADGVPLQADVRHEDGFVRCRKRSNDAAALRLQFATVAGLVTIQTCLLPQREAPYLLSLELARHRIMLVLNKLEEWALFDLGAGDPVMERFEVARRAFTDAVVIAGKGPSGEADRLARTALDRAMEASEALALLQGRALFEKRCRGELAAAAEMIRAPANALTDHEAAESRNALLGTVGVIVPGMPTVGCVVSPDQFTPAVTKIVSSACDFISLPMRWIEMEPTEGRYSFSKTDRWIEWAVREAKLPITGGPVVDFRARAVPEWLYIWEHDYETLRELVFEHVKQIVTRYRRTVGTWTVVGGLHVNSSFSLSFEQVMDLTRLCVLQVKKLQPGARVQVEVDLPWGEGSGARSVPAPLYAEMMVQSGLPVDAIALCIEAGQPERGRSTRDLMEFSAVLDEYGALEKPVALAVLSAPSRPPEPESLGMGRELEPGYWRRHWSEEQQARWMTAMMGAALAKPFVTSVCWQELHDQPNPSTAKHDGLLTAAGQPKIGLRRLEEIRAAVREKRSPLTLEDLSPVGTGV